MSKFTNQTIVITGGASGIGKAAVQRFFSEGANIAIWDMNETAANELILGLNGGSRIVFSKVNVANWDDCQVAAQKTVATFGKIDVLINNAGITRDAAFAKMDAKQWHDVVDVNLNGVFNATKAVVDNMIQNKFGRIINTSSVVAHYGNFGQANYTATKGAVVSFSKTLAKELGRHNITVNAVAPGFIATDMINTIPESVLQMIIAKSPLGRAGKAEDIASAYVFLASQEANYISGAVLNVDGGLTF